MIPDIYILNVASIFGALVGSFLNVVILRLPEEGSSIVFPGSHCPKCKHNLAWYENVPIISYLCLGGKCKSCKVHISMQYPVVELLMAILSMAIVYRFDLSIASLGFFIFCAALVVIIWIDIHLQIIPDVISLPGIIVGFLFSFINPLVTWQSSLIGLLVGGGILYSIALAYYLIRKHDGMGGGDIKLLAMLGAFLGWQSLPFIIFFSSITGTIAGLLAMIKQGKGGQTRIPFGPFLAGGGLLYLFFFERVNALYYWYLTLSTTG